jgi:hypothetical protein
MAAEISTPVGDAPIIPILLIGIGGYIAWFAIHYWADPAVIWPSDPVKAVLQGGGLPAHTTAAAAGTTAAAQLTAFEASLPAAPVAEGTAGPLAPKSKQAANRARLTAGRTGGGPKK